MQKRAPMMLSSVVISSWRLLVSALPFRVRYPRQSPHRAQVPFSLRCKVLAVHFFLFVPPIAQFSQSVDQLMEIPVSTTITTTPTSASNVVGTQNENSSSAVS